MKKILMKKRIILATAVLMMGVTGVQASHLTVNLSQAGTLTNEVTKKNLKATDSLTVEGPMNRKDLQLACQASAEGSLRYLNIAEAVFEDNKLPDYAFSLDNGTPVVFNKLILPDNLIEFGQYSFRKADIVTLDFPETLRTLGVGTFMSSCIGKKDDISYFELPEGIEELPDKCFFAARIGYIEMPSTIKRIGNQCFFSATFTLRFFPENLESIGESAFCHTGLRTAELPDKCHTIGKAAFNDCPFLSRLVIPAPLTEIPEHFASSCKLTELEIPEGVKKIGDSAFALNGSITKIIFHEGLEEIGKNAFMTIYEVPEIILPSTLKLIKYNGLNYKSTVYCQATTPPECEEQAIYGDKLYVPTGSGDLYKAHTVWRKFKNIEEIETSQFPSAIGELGADSNSEITIYAADGELRIASETTAVYAVYTPDGRMVASGIAAPEASVALPGGIYIVHAGKQTLKIAL